MISIGNHFCILAPDESPPADSRLPLRIARGAFGSGEHETTASCLEFLGEMDVSGTRVLDLGSGTGILAIAALKRGATDALCVDISPDAVRTARHNCALNGLEDRVRHLAGTLDEVTESSFDLVLANIYGDLLLDLAPDLVGHTRPGGYLLLSGMLWEYHFDVRKRFEGLGCRVLRRRMLEEFATLLLQAG